MAINLERSVSEVDGNELLRQSQGGSSEAFGELYTLYHSRVSNYFFRRTNNRAVADDLTQDVFIKAWMARARFEERGIPVTAWLFSIARRALIDNGRRGKDSILVGSLDNNPMLSEGMASKDPYVSPETQVLRREGNERLNGALSQIGESQRRVLISRYVSKRSFAEIAGDMGVSEEAAKKHKKRGVDALRAGFPDFREIIEDFSS